MALNKKRISSKLSSNATESKVETTVTPVVETTATPECSITKEDFDALKSALEAIVQLSTNNAEKVIELERRLDESEKKLEESMSKQEELEKRLEALSDDEDEDDEDEDDEDEDDEDEDGEDDEDEGYTPDDIDCMKTYKAFKKLDSKKQQAVIISVMKSLDMKGLKPDTIKTDKVVAFEVADTLTEPEYGFDVEELVKA